MKLVLTCLAVALFQFSAFAATYCAVGNLPPTNVPAIQKAIGSKDLNVVLTDTPELKVTVLNVQPDYDRSNFVANLSIVLNGTKMELHGAFSSPGPTLWLQIGDKAVSCYVEKE